MRSAVATINGHLSSADSALQSIATYLITDVFKGDWKQAMNAPESNPVFLGIRERAGKPGFPISRPTLSLATRIGAWDAQIPHEAWQNLKTWAKRRLLPLGTEAALLRGAIHVTTMSLSPDAITAYVAAKQSQGDGARPPSLRLVGHAVAPFEELDSAEMRAKFLVGAKKLPAKRRKALMERLTTARRTIDVLLDALDMRDD